MTKRKSIDEIPKVPVKVYHGTSSKNLAGIQKHGLVPKAPNVEKWKPYRITKRESVAYVSFADLTSAVCWARRDVKYKGGTPVVLELKPVASNVKVRYIRTPLIFCKDKLRWHPEFATKKQVPFEALKVIDVKKKCKEAKLKGTGKKSPYCQ